MIKSLAVALISLAVTSLSFANDLEIKGYIKPDPLRGGNNYLIFNNKGKATGRIKADPLWPSNSGRYLILDNKGNEAGIIRPDYLNRDGYIIETITDD
ncbi:MAG: hypothetical protein JSW07_07355 [bacterium]|nr:MAG: hypothetical protein JSW07_07355 [bacterium]